MISVTMTSEMQHVRDLNLRTDLCHARFRGVETSALGKVARDEISLDRGERQFRKAATLSVVRQRQRFHPPSVIVLATREE